MDEPMRRDEDEPWPEPAPAPGSYLVVVEQVYYQVRGEEPAAAESRYARHVSGDEQCYERHVRAGPEWRPLDLGWLAGRPLSLLVLRNDEGRHLDANPTPERRRELDGRVVELAQDGGGAFALVRPGESLRLEPADPARLRLRCRAGAARCVLGAYPG